MRLPCVSIYISISQYALKVLPLGSTDVLTAVGRSAD